MLSKHLEVHVVVAFVSRLRMVVPRDYSTNPRGNHGLNISVIVLDNPPICFSARKISPTDRTVSLWSKIALKSFKISRNKISPIVFGTFSLHTKQMIRHRSKYSKVTQYPRSSFESSFSRTRHPLSTSRTELDRSRNDPKIDRLCLLYHHHYLCVVFHGVGVWAERICALCAL